MKSTPEREPSPLSPSAEIAELRELLAEAEETIRAIRTGEADAVVTTGKLGTQVFTLEGAGHAYRLLIESMNEGALTLTTEEIIVYANPYFATMVKCPLKRVMGSSLRRFLSVDDRARVREMLLLRGLAGSKILVKLLASDLSQIAVQISIRRTARHGVNSPIIGMVVTDLTEALRSEELLRALTNSVARAQEDERRRVSLELHDGITQLCCAIQFQSQALLESLATRDGSEVQAAEELRDMAGSAAREVERVSHNLRPSALDQLGLAAAMGDFGKEFTARTGIGVTLTCTEPTLRMPAETEMVLYRIFQEALRNAEKHANAKQITVELTLDGLFIQLAIRDDGCGFDPDHRPARRKGLGGLGLVSMRERASFVGGEVKVTSVLRSGTEIQVRIPILHSGPSGADRPKALPLG